MNYVWNCLKRQRFEHGPYVILPVQPDHIELIRRWRNAQIDILRQSAPITRAQQETYYAHHIWPSMERATPSNILMALLHKGQLIGYGGLVHIAWEHQRAEVSCLVDDIRAKHHGLYAEDFSAFIALIRCMAFDDLGFHRLCTETYAIRAQTIYLLELAGFRREGVLRDHVRIRGAFVDSIVHALLRP